MTDNEIIKALECYRGQLLFSFNGKKPEIYIHDIIDLINRQKAEIERLEEEKEQLKADIEMFTEIGKMYSEIKAEAVKELAEDFKREYFLNGLIHTTSISDSCIDDFVEEFLTGRAGEG